MGQDRINRRNLIFLGTAGLVGLPGCANLYDGREPDEEGTPNGESGPELDIQTTAIRVNRPDIDNTILTGEPVEVTATVKNASDTEGTGDVSLFVGDVEIATRSISPKPNQTTEISFEFSIDQPGTVEIALNETPVEAVTVTTPIDHDRRIGAQYYAWYWGENGYGGGKSADQRDSWLADTPGEPLLGAYDSRNTGVINQHIKWSLEHGIGWWIVNNGAPNGQIDRTIRNTLFEAELADQMEFTILFGFDPNMHRGDGGYNLDDPELREYLIERFVHWEETKIDHDSYLHIDGRPTMYFWDSNIYEGDVAGAFEEAKKAIDADPYIIGGPNYFWQPHREQGLTEVYDAVKDYHSISTDDEYMDRFRELTVKNQRRWRAAADELGFDFFGTVTPGYDTSARTDDPRVQPIVRDPDAFAEECSEVRGLANRDTVVVTSFNEWPEHTVVEPSETEESTFLNVVEDQLARAEWESPQLTYRPLTIEFERTVSISGRELAFQAQEITVETETGSVTENVGSLDETFVYIRGMYGPEEHEETSRWFGGDAAETKLLVEAESEITMVRFVGRPPGEPIAATVRTQDGELGQLTFEDGPTSYEVG